MLNSIVGAKLKVKAYLIHLGKWNRLSQHNQEKFQEDRQ